MPGIKDLIKNAIGGATGGLLTGAANVIEKFVADPTEKLKAMKELEEMKIKHEEAVLNAEKEIELAYLKDMDSARQMQISALNQSDTFSKRFVYYLAIGIILLTFSFDMCFFFVQYPERNHDIINMVAGTLNSTGFAAVIYFFFGSSQGSKSSGDTIRKMLEK